MINRVPLCCFLFAATWSAFLPVQAQGVVEDTTGFNLNDTEFMRRWGLEAGGWVSGGITYSTDNPDSRNNFPITFNDRVNEFQMNQFYLYLERAVNLEAESWDFGGRFDFMFGTDARFTQASGLDDQILSEDFSRFYDIALPQAYVEIFAPFGNGIVAKLGHFYTIIGYEVVTATGNFFYSHAYTMQYAEPFTHTGALFNYSLNENWSLSSGAVLGWDNFDQDLDNWNYLGSVSWVNDEASTSVAWSIITGGVDNSSSDNRTMYSLVVTHNFTDELQYVFQHDFGYQENAASEGDNALWYGINQYLFYQYTDTLSLGLRGEWFRDNNGTRIIEDEPGSYFEITAGVNWSPKSWLIIRPEIRYDWADSNVGVYDDQTEDNQLSFAIDFILTL